jgi:predicted phosphate transport protein (TIGR00153 family)
MFAGLKTALPGEKPETTEEKGREIKHAGMFSKKKHLVKALEEYAEQANETIRLCLDIVNAMFENRGARTLEELAAAVRSSESRCDTLRRGIEYHLYTGALLPSLRGDIFNLLEQYDKVPNKAEDVANFLSLVEPEIPSELHNDFGEILGRTHKAAASLSRALTSLFKNLKDSIAAAKEVELAESTIDKLERQLTRRIFSLEIDTGGKLLIYEFLKMCCAISDRAENASDRIEIIAVKIRT